MARLSLIGVVRDQWSYQKPVIRTDLSGKTVIVVGANTGLGFEASKHFATMNPGRLILACRNQKKGEVALEKLKTETKCTTAELWIVDLASFASVAAFADKFEADGGRLDILVMNAGLVMDTFEPSPEGYETTVQVNHLGTALLSLRLLPRLLDTASKYNVIPRLSVVSSDMHHFGDLPKDLLEKDDILATLASQEYSTISRMKNRYSETKLLNVFFVRALNAHLLRSSPLIVNAISPGYCYSDFRRNLTGVQAVLDWFMEKLLALSTEEGSRQLVWGVLGGEGREEELKGGYVAYSELRETSDFTLGVEGEKLQEKLWNETLMILSKADPKVQDVSREHLSNLPNIQI